MGSVFDSFKATIKLSLEFRQLVIHCFKPEQDGEAIKRRINKERKLSKTMQINNEKFMK
jgi:hypothetical protein